MMTTKKLIGMTMLTALVLMLAGCKADTLSEHQGEVPVMLSTTVVENDITRAATDVLGGTQFGSGETFYAYFPSGVRINNVTSACGTAFTTNGSGGTTPATQPYFNATVNSANVCAYYPYTDGKQVTNATQSFSVELDQTAAAGYKKSDLMYATGTVTKSGSSATGSLTFTHKMAKIIVNVTLGQGISSVISVRIVGGSKTIALSNNASTLGATSDALSTSSYITMYSGTSTSAVSCAGLIPPQTVTSSFLQVVTAEGTATYSVTDKAFASGLSYTYNITINASAIGVTTDVTDWDSQGTTNLVNYGSETAQVAPEAVDLGLPSGVKWANMNVGATAVTDYGTYFMWGDVAGHPGVTTDGFSFAWANYKWGTSSSSLTKYTSSDGKTTLEATDDAARANWGGKWRMPTMEEFNELLNNTTKAWTSDYNDTGVAGYTFKANGQTLFLPAAGDRYLASFDNQGSYGDYWSSTLNTDRPDRAWNLDFGSSNAYVGYGSRYRGYTVRAVWDDRIPPVLGDPYYSDGSWGNNPHANGATVIGIVAWLGSDSDLKCGKSHGLVMAKSDVSSKQTWGPLDTDESFLTNTSTIDGCRSNNKNGLTNTDNLIADSHTHNATSQARAYTPAAPSTSGNTNWFLPSAAQWLAVLGPDGIGKQTTAEQVWGSYYDSDQTAYNKIKNALTATGVDGTALQYSSYWSSSEYNNDRAVRVNFNSSDGVYVDYDLKDYINYYVRAFLAF